jgi:hypothetical protein
MRTQNIMSCSHYKKLTANNNGIYKERRQTVKTENFSLQPVDGKQEHFDFVIPNK